MKSAETAELAEPFGSAVAAWLSWLRTEGGVPQVHIVSGRRSSDEQWALRVQNCPDPAGSPSSACSPPTAPVGSSQHETGQAVDIGPASAYNAAGAAAAQFGLLASVPGEPWHFVLANPSAMPAPATGAPVRTAVGAGPAGELVQLALGPLGMFADPGWWIRGGLGLAGSVAVLLGLAAVTGVSAGGFL